MGSYGKSAAKKKKQIAVVYGKSGYYFQVFKMYFDNAPYVSDY